MQYQEITNEIIGAAYKVYNTLGFGYLESVYQKAMLYLRNVISMRLLNQK